MADANATLQETVEYGAYGQTVYKDAVSGSTATVSYTGNPYGYTGREPDAETGLYYYRARYYDVEAGRFIQKDPIGFKGGDTNLYAYVGNNPSNLLDPRGLRQLTPAEQKEVNIAVHIAKAIQKIHKSDISARLKWFKNAVRIKGRFDLKNRAPLGAAEPCSEGSQAYIEREALGNYNYGAMYAALFSDVRDSGMGLELALWAPGAYSWWTNVKNPPEWNDPFTEPPWGDNPRFTQDIVNGYLGVNDLTW